jgi:serine protease Do
LRNRFSLPPRLVSCVPWLLAAGALLALAPGCATTGLGAESAVLRAKNEVAPALVHIRPVKEVYSLGQRKEVVAIGSGFIISPDGYVVTNEHVAGESNYVNCVLSDKDEMEAEVVGVDPYTDIAVLKLNRDKPLPYVEMGDSSKLEAGQTVLAMGSPHGLSRSVSLGIISVTDRHLDGAGTRISPYNTWIQTDAAINPGNSGGPLCNLRGEVIGVNSRVLRGAENVGFAIPVNTVKRVVEDIISTGRVHRSWVGLDLQEMLARTDDASIEGVVVSGVAPLSPASDTDIQPGDILVAVNGKSVNARFEEDLPDIEQLIADLPVGEPATLTLRRGDEDMSVEVVTSEKGGLKGEEVEFSEWGFTAAELTPEIVRRAQLPARMGVHISGVQVGGIAGNAQLGTGDIILRVDDEPIENLAAFRDLYEARVETGQELVLMLVKRGALTRYVMIEQGEQPEVPATEEETL